MRINKFVPITISLVIISSLSYGWTGWVIAEKVSSGNIKSLAKLSQVCNKSVGKDGFGKVRLNNVNLQSETGTINVPCRLRVRAGSNLQLNNIQLTTKHLVIEVVPVKGQMSPVNITIANSRFSGTDAGFQLSLKAPGSQVTVTNSSFDYSASIGWAVGADDDDNSAKLTVTGNTMRSVGNSEGISLVTTGQAIFQDNNFELTSLDDTALLLGTDCQIANNTHANQDCPSP